MHDSARRLLPPLHFVIRDFIIRYCFLPTIFIIAFALAGVFLLIAGDTFDLFIGSIFLATMLAPPCSAIAGRLPGAFASVVALTSAFAICWLMPVHDHAITVQQWCICVLIILSFLALLMSGVLALMRIGLSPAASSAMITITALLWLSWPVWLSASIAGAQLHYSTEFQPLFAINGVVSNLGIWTEQQVAYNLTSLGQDVQYQLPATAWPAIGLQSLLSLMLLVVARYTPGIKGIASG